MFWSKPAPPAPPEKPKAKKPKVEEKPREEEAEEKEAKPAPPAPEDYWTLVCQPLMSLFFLTPLFLAYELGMMYTGTERKMTVQNGADSLLRGWLTEFGLDQPFLLPGIVAVILIIWQVAGRFRIQFRPSAFCGMAFESMLFASFLVVVGQLQDIAFQHYQIPKTMAVGAANSTLLWEKFVTFVGAGVYEEVLFRLCLLPVLYIVLRGLMLPASFAAFAAIILNSGAFAAAHYIGPGADPFTIFTCSFRALAGLVFSALFMWRGFGVTVGCHTVYDLLVGIMLQARQTS
ncbi:MAG: CPBP family glutamic-type intramembrane protease [Planctomycetales bacterium]